MSGITRRDLLKALGASGVVLGGMSSSITGLDKLIAGDGLGSLGIGMDKSYGADTIKPGTVIDSGNYTNYPQLKELMPESLYRRLKKGATRSDLPPVHVVATRKIKLAPKEQEWLEKNKDVVKVDPKTNQLLNYKAGRPFAEPKNLQEIVANISTRPFYGDGMEFTKCTMFILDKLNRRKELEWSLFHRPMMERTTVAPVPEYPNNPDQILWKQSSVFRKPYDVAGFALLRYQYKAFNRPDDAWAYVPAIRRVRRYTGADSQDPLLGSDLTFDDFANFQQKIDYKTVVPVKAEEGKILTWGYFPEYRFDGHKMKIEGRQLHIPAWEIRPIYKLTFKINDPNYMYSKRVIYVDTETYLSPYGEYYDQKGNLYRTHQAGFYWTEKGEHCWAQYEIEDWINGSKTFNPFMTGEYNKQLPDEYFSKDFLSRIGR